MGVHNHKRSFREAFNEPFDEPLPTKTKRKKSSGELISIEIPSAPVSSSPTLEASLVKPIEPNDPIFSLSPSKTHESAKLLLGYESPKAYGSPVRERCKPLISYQPPEAPFKRSLKKFESGFVINALQMIENGAITKNGHQFLISPVKGMKGQHSQIYRILADQLPLLEGIHNEDLYIKTFQESVIAKSRDKGIAYFLDNLLTQYQQLVAERLPVVKIFNADTAKKDGYLIVEKLNAFEIPWNAATNDEDLARYQNELSSIKMLFEYAQRSKSSIPLDLNRGNFGINQNGQLVLLDFMEHDEDEENAFNLIRSKCLESVSNGCEAVYQYLNHPENS